jgi:hypothetical protein
MEVITINENEQFIGYNCIYRYEIDKVKLACDISTGMWRLCSDNDYSKEEEKQLNKSLDFVNEYIRIDLGYTLAEQIQNILKYFDRYFHVKNDIVLEHDQAKKNETKTKSNELIINPKRLKEDVIYDDLYSYITDCPPVTRSARPIRQNSTCNVKNSVRYDL